MGRREKPVDPDAGPVQRLAHDLRVLREQAGTPPYREMARRANYSSSALAAAAAGEQLPSSAVVLAYARALDADREEWEERWRAARDAVEEQAVREPAADADAPPPYRGLARFEPADSALFFGRDRLVGELLELVREHRFAAVFGPSGSGKSSLLRAGLIPALQAAEGAERPAVVRVLTPGERPADTHEKALLAEDDEHDTWVIVDQFEELFTLCRDREQEGRFLDLLLAAREPGSRLRVVVAVRGDFYGHCAARGDLAEAVSGANLLVGPMSRDELREVITKPAAAAGLLVERALTARIIDEVGDRPGALPMLSHALLETWRRRRGRTLTEAAYEAAGGARGAIAATAEAAYGELSEARARVARRILLRLIAPGQQTGAADTRRPARRDELGPGAPEVLEHLAAARLVTLDDDTVELAHEALITGWPRLAAWIEEDRERLREQRRLGEAARSWAELDQDQGALYRGTRLGRAEELFCGRADDDLAGPERDFLTASLTARDWTTRKRRVRTAAVCACVVLALVAGLAAWQQNRAGRQEADKAAARRLAASAAGLRTTDPRTAALLGVAAWKTAGLTESRSALLGSLFQPQLDAFTDPGTGRDTRRFLTDQGRRLVSVTGRRVSVRDVATHRLTSSYVLPSGRDVIDVGPDARTVDLSGPGSDGGEQLWDLAQGKALAGPRDQAVLAYAADGQSYVSVPSTQDGPLRVFRPGDDHARFQVPMASAPVSAALGTDGRLLAVCPAGGAPQVWDTARDAPVPGAWDKEKNLCGTGSGADGVDHLLRFSADGKRLVATSDGGFDVWDVAGGRVIASLADPGDGGFTQAAFTPDGRFLATADNQGLTVWRLTGGGLQVFRTALTGTQVGDLTWAPGRRHVLRFLDGTTVRSYDLTTPLSATWQDTSSDTSTLSPDGSTLAIVTGSSFQLRSARTRAVLAKATVGTLPTSDGNAPLLSFSPDGRALVVSDIVHTKDAEKQRFTVWDVPAHKIRTSFEVAGTYDTPMAPIALGAEGRTLLVSHPTDHGTVTEVWTLTGARHRTKATVPGFGWSAVALRPDGDLVVEADDQYARPSDRSVTGRELADGRQVTALAFSPDGRRLAVGDASGRVTLWDGGVGHRTGVLPASTGAAVSALAFSADGGTLAVGGGGVLRLWDTATQQTLGTELPTPGDDIRSVAFSRDGGTLYATGPQTPLLTYSITPDRAVAAVCARMGGGLTRAQWRTYVPDAPYQDICAGT
ncbi:hypothetical protein ACQEWB_04325 [Streptomyces sp. CA-249302]|uniref:nSTAND1 domain-containing NTPase n=1 Tax=Streptomyces sp. CA-249302 TaxID=3240058 RepID=UPI003D94F373